MALWDRITRLFQKTEPPSAAIAPSVRTAASSGGYTDLGAQFRAETQRRAIVQDCRAMYESDIRVKRAINTLARDATRGGCAIAVANNPWAQEIADGLITRLDLNSRLDDWMRYTLVDGNTMLEVSVSDALQIESVTRKPFLQMRRNSNRADTFDDPRRAFWLSEQAWAAEPTQATLWFAEWQIVHARWDHDEGKRYGSPLFAAATSAYKRVTEGEVDIAVRRKTRAGMRYNHEFPPGTPQIDIDAYIELNQDALDDPLGAVSDFFGTAKVNTVQGDARLQEIGDVEYHVSTLGMAGIVPLELIGYGENLNRDVLQEKKEQYDRDLENMPAWVEAQLVKPLLEREWLLHGIFPASVAYEVKWKSKQVVTPRMLLELAQALAALRALGLNDVVIMTLLEQFFPNLNLQTLLGDAGQANPARLGNALAAEG